jgi:malate synthase
MEDAATAEISRAQLWQWIRHNAKLDDGRGVDVALCRKLLKEELAKMRTSTENGGHEQAAELFLTLIEDRVFPEFLTMPAYDRIVAGGV